MRSGAMLARLAEDKAALAVLGLNPLEQTKIVAGVDKLKSGNPGSRDFMVFVICSSFFRSAADGRAPSGPIVEEGKSKFELVHLTPHTPEFADAEDQFKAALNNQISCCKLLLLCALCCVLGCCVWLYPFVSLLLTTWHVCRQ